MFWCRNVTETFSVFSFLISNVIDTITKTESSFDPKISGVTKYHSSSKRENNIRYLKRPPSVVSASRELTVIAEFLGCCLEPKCFFNNGKKRNKNDRLK